MLENRLMLEVRIGPRCRGGAWDRIGHRQRLFLFWINGGTACQSKIDHGSADPTHYARQDRRSSACIRCRDEKWMEIGRFSSSPPEIRRGSAAQRTGVV